MPQELDALLTAVSEMGRIAGVTTPYIDTVLALTQQMGEVAGVYPVFPRARPVNCLPEAAAAQV